MVRLVSLDYRGPSPRGDARAPLRIDAVVSGAEEVLDLSVWEIVRDDIGWSRRRRWTNGEVERSPEIARWVLEQVRARRV